MILLHSPSSRVLVFLVMRLWSWISCSYVFFRVWSEFPWLTCHLFIEQIKLEHIYWIFSHFYSLFIDGIGNGNLNIPRLILSCFTYKSLLMTPYFLITRISHACSKCFIIGSRVNPTRNSRSWKGLGNGEAKLSHQIWKQRDHEEQAKIILPNNFKRFEDYNNKKIYWRGVTENVLSTVYYWIRCITTQSL